MQTLKLNDKLLIDVMSGSKTFTIRKGKRNIRRGPLQFNGTEMGIAVRVVDVISGPLYRVHPDIDYHTTLCKYYPDLSVSDIVTKIVFEYPLRTYADEDLFRKFWTDFKVSSYVPKDKIYIISGIHE